MYVTIITTDELTEDKRLDLIDAIVPHGDWLELSNTTFALNSDVPAEQLLAELKDVLWWVNTGVFLVIPLRASYAGQMPAKVRYWLNNPKSSKQVRETQ